MSQVSRSVIATSPSSSGQNYYYKNSTIGALSCVATEDPVESEIVIAVMGATGTGKTSVSPKGEIDLEYQALTVMTYQFINEASGGNLRVGMGLRSCTSKVEIASTFELDGKSVTLIDTPGFDDTTKSDTEILRMIAAFLATAYEYGQKLAGVIYIHRISDFRMTGVSSRNFKMFRELCGDSTLRNVVILTNMWGEVSQAIGEAREQELRSQDIFFKPVLDKGAILLRHDHTHESALNVLRHIINNKVVTLQIQRELVVEKKDISETAAGAELNRELMEQIKKHRKELDQVKKEMRDAIQLKDEETRRELEAETKRLEEEMRKVQSDSENLASQYSKEKAKMEQRMQEFTENSRRAEEQARAEYSQQISVLREQLSQTSAAGADQRARLENQIAQLQRRPRRGGFFRAIGQAIDSIFGL